MDKTTSPVIIQLLAKKKIIFGTGMLLIVVIGMGIFWMVSSGKPIEEKTTSLPPEITTGGKKLSQPKEKSSNNKSATLSLGFVDGKKTYRVGEEILLVASGHTKGQPIIGYDVIFRFDDELVSYKKEADLFPTMLYDLRVRGNWIIITGVMPYGKNNTVVLEDTKLVQIHFTAKKPGVAHFPLSFVPQRLNDANLMSKTAEDILTDVKGISVTITP